MARRRDLLKLLPVAPLALSAADASKLPNTVVDPETAPLKKLPFGEAHVYFEGATDQVRSMVGWSLRLAVGKSDPPHKHEEEEFMVIAEGSAEILVDGKTVKVKPGSMMYCASRGRRYRSTSILRRSRKRIPMSTRRNRTCTTSRSKSPQCRNG